MQNYVYRSREEALAAPDGRLTITVCRRCGFAWNSRFDPDRLVYDAGYDNAVSSAVMKAHYRDVATFLSKRHPLEGGLVVDVGCGNGAFLKTLCEEVPTCRGLGIDPALDADWDDGTGRLRLLKSVFTPDLIEERPSLLTCRHVLEHLHEPVEFVREIRRAVERFGAVPVFFEVPDLRWIVENEAFQDFCYEHCNYFTAESFAELLRRAGFDPVGTHSVFGSQYLLIKASLAPELGTPNGSGSADEIANSMLAYAATEAARISSIRDRLRRQDDEGRAIVVWGMATKGVLFSLLIDPERTLIDFCIDINSNKQGCFVPLTGHLIAGPDALREAPLGEQIAVSVMNENYRGEVESTCRAMGIEPIFVSASPLEP